MKELRCRDVGFDCSAVVRAETEEEVMRQAAKHAAAVHGLTDIDTDTAQTIRSKIHSA